MNNISQQRGRVRNTQYCADHADHHTNWRAPYDERRPVLRKLSHMSIENMMVKTPELGAMTSADSANLGQGGITTSVLLVISF